jgi:L-fuculose-phosphate aldolase
MVKEQVKDEYLQKVVDGGAVMVEKGLTVGTWGNISVRDPETQLVYVKPSGMVYEDITPDDVVVFNLDGQIVSGHRKPTIEYQFHLGIMRSREEINYVIHTHPVYSAVMGELNEDLPGVSEDFVQLVGAKIVNCEYALPGTRELADNIVKSLGDRRAVMIPNHGTVCCGEDFKTVMKVCFVVEKCAHIYLLAKSAGTPHLISDEDILAMQDFARNHYGQGK